MKYDGKNNIWNVVASLPQPTLFITGVTQCRDCIFVTRSDLRGIPIRHTSYIFNPSIVKWIEADGGGEEDFEVCSAMKLEV